MMMLNGIDAASSAYATARPSQAGQSRPESVMRSTTDSVQFSEEALRLMRAQRASEAEISQFAGIIQRAHEEGGYADPKAFLNQLNPDEMEVVRKAHGLARSIDVGALDFEGAHNLLLPHDEARDLNNDGLLSIGAGRTITFPPPNAPASVKQAWEDATAGMDERDRWLYEARMFSSQHIANIHRNADGSITVTEPGTSGYRNPFAEPGFSYQTLVKAHLESIEYAREKGWIDEAQYYKDKAFLSGFGEALRQQGAV